MKNLSTKTSLREILNSEDLDNVRIRFNLQVRDNWNPIEYLQNNDLNTLLEGHYWNFARRRSFREGQVTVGFIRIDREENLWLLFHVGKVTKELGIPNAMGYEYEVLSKYHEYFGRLVIRFKNRAQRLIRIASSVIDDCEVVKDCEVVEGLSDALLNTVFPK